jgi:hypothetical protein
MNSRIAFVVGLLALLPGCSERAKACDGFAKIMNESTAEWTAIGGPVQADPSTYTRAANAANAILERVNKLGTGGELEGTLRLFKAELTNLKGSAEQVAAEPAGEQQNFLVRSYEAQWKRVRDSREATFKSCK